MHPLTVTGGAEENVGSGVDEDEEEDEEEEEATALAGRMSTLRPAWIVLLQKCFTAVVIHFPFESLQRGRKCQFTCEAD